MSRTFADKLFLLILTLIAVAGNVILGSEDGVGTLLVITVMITASVYGLTELVRYRYLPFALLTLAVILFVVFGGCFAFVFPSVCYPVCIEPKRSMALKIAVPALLAGISVFAGLPVAVPVIMLVVLASYMAVNTSVSEAKIAQLTSDYDKARENVIREQNKRRKAIESSENDAYLAMLKERNRIAREIHDNVGHILTRSIVQMEAVKVINKDENIKPYLDSVAESMGNAMSSIRKSVHELHDDSIDLSVGLNDMIKSMDKKFDCKLMTSIESPASNEFKNMVLGIVKESLTNITKYSSGDKVRVEVVENNTFWRIFVWDNGICEEHDYSDNDFDSSGIGLDNIRSRAVKFGGKARIFAGKDGFTVLVTVPKET